MAANEPQNRSTGTRVIEPLEPVGLILAAAHHWLYLLLLYMLLFVFFYNNITTYNKDKW